MLGDRSLEHFGRVEFDRADQCRNKCENRAQSQPEDRGEPPRLGNLHPPVALVLALAKPKHRALVGRRKRRKLERIAILNQCARSGGIDPIEKSNDPPMQSFGQIIRFAAPSGTLEHRRRPFEAGLAEAPFEARRKEDIIVLVLESHRDTVGDIGIDFNLRAFDPRPEDEMPGRLFGHESGRRHRQLGVELHREEPVRALGPAAQEFDS